MNTFYKFSPVFLWLHLSTSYSQQQQQFLDRRSNLLGTSLPASTFQKQMNPLGVLEYFGILGSCLYNFWGEVGGVGFEQLPITASLSVTVLVVEKKLVVASWEDFLLGLYPFAAIKLFGLCSNLVSFACLAVPTPPGQGSSRGVFCKLLYRGAFAPRSNPLPFCLYEVPLFIPFLKRRWAFHILL